MAVNRNCLCAALAVVGAGQAASQPVELQPRALPISLQQGKLVGPDAELILRAAKKSQFVAIGEEHNDRHIPAITTALFRILHQTSGFNYLAEEQDPSMMRTISTAPARGNLKRIQALAQRYKLGFTFISDQELEMLAAIGAASTGRGRPIWGCEQAFGLTHVLDKVAARAPNAAARNLVKKLRAEAAEGEAVRNLQSGHFIEKPEIRSELQSLARVYAKADPDARFLVDSLATSNEIYVYHANGAAHRLPGRYTANSTREEYMKSVCRAEYVRARNHDGREPKVLLKFGQNHLFEQWGPNDFSTVGNFFANIARWNGTRYTSIATFYSTINGQPAWKNANLAFLSAFKDVIPSSGWAVIDLRQLRDGPAHDALFASAQDLNASQQQQLSGLVDGFDFLPTLGPSERATFDVAKVKY
jgi:hypothetical protein